MNHAGRRGGALVMPMETPIEPGMMSESGWRWRRDQAGDRFWGQARDDEGKGQSQM